MTIVGDHVEAVVVIGMVFKGNLYNVLSPRQIVICHTEDSNGESVCLGRFLIILRTLSFYLGIAMVHNSCQVIIQVCHCFHRCRSAASIVVASFIRRHGYFTPRHLVLRMRQVQLWGVVVLMVMTGMVSHVGLALPAEVLFAQHLQCIQVVLQELILLVFFRVLRCVVHFDDVVERENHFLKAVVRLVLTTRVAEHHDGRWRVTKLMKLQVVL
mmetsp:Transcript_27047/g.45627  ORF Transcript_27047/g.45627 Transcript_27047/m.45627 type:complete len:213 (-) Transcript_27047:1231-1869(-)